MNGWHIVIIDSFPDAFPRHLHAMGAKVSFRPDCSKAEAVELLKEADILVINSKIHLNTETLASAKRLKLVCRAGVGLDHFDLPLLEKMAVKVCFTPGANAVTVAEHAAGMLIGMMHNIARANQQVKNQEWVREQNRGTELMGKTIGIIGYGNTGSAVAKCLSGFKMKILAYDKYKSGFGNEMVQEVGMQKIFEEADILTLHIPLSAETEHLADETFFSGFKKNIWLMNLSRGAVVKTTDLVAALKSGKVIGAALDVLENERLDSLTSAQKDDFDALRSMHNVILTPHIGGWSFESLDRINNEIVRQISEFTGLK